MPSPDAPGAATSSGNALGVGDSLDAIAVTITGSALIEAIISDNLAGVLLQPRIKLVMAVDISILRTEPL